MNDTKHFQSNEFKCKCCGIEKMQQSIIDTLEILRVACDCSIMVMSGYRCLKHNTEVGGAKRSAHLNGTASDIISKLPIKSLFTIAERVIPQARIGISLHDHFLHIDIEPPETYPCRRWYYLTSGGESVITEEWRKENLL